MKKFIVLMGLLLIVATSAYADNLFRWKDKEGKVHYGDRPAEDAVDTETKKFGAPADGGDDDLSYGTRKAKQNFPVTLYVSANCGNPCEQARLFLNKRGIPYSEKVIKTDEDLASFKKLSGGESVPSLTIGKSLLSGFEAGQWNGELDIVGYPKTAPYGKRPSPAPVAKPTTPDSDVK